VKPQPATERGDEIVGNDGSSWETVPTSSKHGEAVSEGIGMPFSIANDQAEMDGMIVGISLLTLELYKLSIQYLWFHLQRRLGVVDASSS
jgi:hypothetical protein